ncbi:tRNA 2-thiouridine synthesizing protein A [Pseudochelatococcus lubricantis]|uniref:tRNA 2-thiouridine synthesizing protein A n=1 Tax=Pseudochelatococcus lubricantis TaxID=1538102 RepID=A0ABX0UVQ2_9HYPH|nr:sulfurtransferase TusA family protein [Pseudochelatococcus lubricantis]NIJ57031.1 tRNA 2-thiouridine synthesizing protein A [Pseudochelatococcus lubricantis]
MDAAGAGRGETVHLDLRGLKCPLPALRTRKALARAAPGTLLVVACTDPLAGIDIPHLVRETGHILEGNAPETDAPPEGGARIFTIRVVANQPAA